MRIIIKSMFLVAILALVVTGCQKEGDDLNVSLKSSIAFTGGIYISNWQSGNAEFECALAGGCDGGSYKIDSNVDLGVNFNEGGVTVTGINKQKFSWTSIYPVCKIIVKAGSGAYIFDIGGSLSGTVPYPTDLNVKAKDISHITFCFGKTETTPEWVIALKTIITIPEEWPYAFAVSGGSILADDVFSIGYNKYALGAVNTYPLMFGFGPFDQIGTITTRDFTENNTHFLEVVIDTYREDWMFNASYLYVGTLDGLNNYMVPFPDGNTGLQYSVFPFFKDELAGQRIFTIPFNEISD